ncbi:hypothetical protein CLIB1423_35S00408 [[Candida] railenensis]|uniref:CWH43-like N-terminal domain-containing protein n=1 Tax=[Candida] railenensis TaxID=45579 RepID=A0A9P0QUD6_9ASCO|nr:hypothetical protein CLIB1423_35S00408 [[Candida] railenensis]
MKVLTYIKEKAGEFTSNFNHFYLIPLFGFICWYTLFLALVGIWCVRGNQSYVAYDEFVKPLPLERIGAIEVPVFFCIFIFIHAIIFCISMYLEFYHRKIGKLIKFAKPHLQTRLAYASLVFGFIAQCFFVIQAVRSTVLIKQRKRAETHYAIFLAVFAILVLVSLALNFVNYYIMGQYYRQYVNGERWNKFTNSFLLKVIWLIVTIVLAVTTCVFYVTGKAKPSRILEWAFHFWYGLLLAFWTYDLYPITELKALREKANGTHEESTTRKLINKMSWSHHKTFTGVRESVIEVSSNLEIGSSSSSPDSPGIDYMANYPGIHH